FLRIVTSQTTADVTIDLAPIQTTACTATPSPPSFSGSCSTAPQTLPSSPTRRSSDLSDIAYTIETSAAASGDPNYDGIDPDDVGATDIDADPAGSAVTATRRLPTTEAGGTATFTIVLTSQPIADVTIDLTSSATTEGT